MGRGGLSRTLLLDTCAAIWSVQPDRRFAATDLELVRTKAEGGRILVSPITAWEVGQLVSLGRLLLTASPERWFAELATDGVELAPMPPETLIQSSFLPHSRLRDPADKIIAATARALGCIVVTRDAALLDYAEAGWISALAC